MRYYIVETRDPSAWHTGTVVVHLVAAESCAQAFDMSQRDERKRTGMPTSHAMHSKKVAEFDDEKDAAAFYESLTADAPREFTA